jgi:hypothetical protein
MTRPPSPGGGTRPIRLTSPISRIPPVADGRAAQFLLGVHELRSVNDAPRDIEEDQIRDCDRSGDFGQRFIELARSVYQQNDRRAAIKRRMNERFGSKSIEQKSLPCRMGRMIRAGLTLLALRKSKRLLRLIAALSDGTDGTDDFRLYALYCAWPQMSHSQGGCNPLAANPLRWVAPTLRRRDRCRATYNVLRDA